MQVFCGPFRAKLTVADHALELFHFRLIDYAFVTLGAKANGFRFFILQQREPLKAESTAFVPEI